MTSLYDSIIGTTDKHLGREADRFVARQIRSHLQKDPRELQPEDLSPLIDWIQLAMRMVNDDAVAVDHYIADLQSLANPGNIMIGVKSVGR